ncbi:MAG: universal stress protein [Anaerolineales bacterium]|nr:universal stress protein [Anaerolineales bacterium]HEY62011.1 universal stress protein [Anaerolineae bacterium]
MSGIVCAIRGGPSSQSTIEKAIELALEYSLPIYFVYVVNLDFMAHSSSSRVHMISQELEHLGEFILLNAKSKAEKMGVAAEGIIRHGEVGNEIIEVSREYDANFVILGQPRRKGEEDFFSDKRLKVFASNIEEKTNAKAVLTEVNQNNEA